MERSIKTINEYIGEARDGIIEAEVFFPGFTIPSRIYLLAEDIVFRGDDIMGWWFVGSDRPLAKKIIKAVRDVDELYIELKGTAGPPSDLKMTLSFPYGAPVKRMAKDWRDNGPRNKTADINGLIDLIGDEL